MKNSPYLLFTTFFFRLFIACDTANNELETMLLKAEALMEQAPDSALTILQTLEDSHEAMSQGEYALWCLLITQAYDKNFISHTSDSLIRHAIHYYEKQKDKSRLMQSYYYMGSVWFDLNDAPRAQEFFLKALEPANELGDYAFLGRIYSNLSSLYLYDDINDKAHEFAKKALKCFLETNDTTNIGYALQNIGRVYTAENRLDSALYFYSQAIEYITPVNILDLYNDLGIVYKLNGEYDLALEYIQKAFSMEDPLNDTTPVLCNLGNTYRLLGKRDSAVYYLTQCLHSANIYTQANANKALAEIAEEEQNWGESSAFWKANSLLRDSINEKSLSDNLAKVQNLYDFQKAEKEANEHQLKASNRLMFIYQLVAIILLILISFILIIVRLQKAKRTIEDQKDKAERLKQQHYYLSEEYQKVKAERDERIRQLEHSLTDIENKKTAQNEINEKFFSSELYQKINSKAKLTDSEWKDIEIWVESHSPEFTRRLRELCPRIKDDEIKFCLLKKIKIPVHFIAEHLNISSTAATQKGKRLHKKLTGIPASAKEFEKYLAEF